MGTMESLGGRFRMFPEGTLSTAVMRKYPFQEYPTKHSKLKPEMDWEGIYQMCHLLKRMGSGGYLALTRLCLRVRGKTHQR